jgi:hypothetical protein
MQERGAEQFGEQPDGYYYDEDDVPRRSGGQGPGSSAPAPRGPQAGLVVGAVVLAAALGAGAFAAWHASHSAQDNPTVQAGATTSSSGPTSPAPSAPASPTSPTAPSSSATTAVPAVTSPLIVPPASEASVGEFYGAALASLVPNSPPPADPAAAFVSATVAAQYWDSASKAAKPAALCGASGATEAIVAGGGHAVNVSFYGKGELADQEANVAVDPKTGKISSISCAAAVPPSYVGTATVVKYFWQASSGALPAKSSTTYAPTSENGPVPWINYDLDTCSQYGPVTWILYAPVVTKSGAAWQFEYDGSGYRQDVFVDPATGSIERTLCETFPAIPAPDKAAAGKKSADGLPDPAQSMVGRLFDAYIMERSRVSLGAVPTDEIAPYFDSTTAYATALNATHKYPFLCATKAPDGAVLGAPKVSGSTETFEMTLTYTAGAPPMDNPPVVGKQKVVVDLDTMKIKSITCG